MRNNSAISGAFSFLASGTQAFAPTLSGGLPNYAMQRSSRVMKLIRLAAGVFVSIGVLLVLDLIPWKMDAAQLSPVQLLFALGVTAAVCMGVAAFGGAIVARVNFIVPAVLLACGWWHLAITFVEAVKYGFSHFGSGMTRVAVLAGLALTIGGAIIGAMLGRRFCQQNEDKDSTAA